MGVLGEGGFVGGDERRGEEVKEVKRQGGGLGGGVQAPPPTGGEGSTLPRSLQPIKTSVRGDGGMTAGMTSGPGGYDPDAW